MKTIRTSTLPVIAAALAAAIALVATRNVALPVAGMFEFLAGAAALTGLLVITGRDLANNPAAQGLRLSINAQPRAAAKPVAARPSRVTVARVPQPAPLMRPVAIRRREPALVEAA